MTEPKWRRISRPFVAPAEILSPDGQQFLVYGADSLLAYLNFREQRISDLEARAAHYRRMAYEHGCSSAYVCDDCESEWGGESPFNQGVEWEDWLARYDALALPSTTKETQ